jgi:regulator of sigma E protease
MEAEDATAESPRSFTAQHKWKRVVILAAGAFFNFVAGAIIVLMLSAGVDSLVGTTVTSLAPGFPDDGARGLLAGDTSYSVNGERTWYSGDCLMFMSLPDGADGVIDMVVVRGGQKVALNGYTLVPREYTDNGVTATRLGINLNAFQPNFGDKLKFAAYTTMDFVRMVRLSLVQMFSGGVKLNDFSGPVGIVSVINDVGSTENVPVSVRLWEIARLGAFIAINLAIFNMLPLPALDGGRIFATAVTAVIERVTRRRLNPKYEGYVHGAGLVLLLGFSAIILVNDIVKLVR